MVNKWKVTAIVFIVLFLLETALLIYSIILSNEMITNENECSVNLCSGYDSYYYDEYNKVCSCYGQDVYGETVVMNQTYMR